MLVLVGPPGSGKKDLAMKLVDEFSDYFGYGSVLIDNNIKDNNNLLYLCQWKNQRSVFLLDDTLA